MTTMRRMKNETSAEFAARKLARVAQENRIAHARNQAQSAINENRCPVCGGSVRLNTTLDGWVTCAQRGAVGFRKDPTKPACDWNGFTR